MIPSPRVILKPAWACAGAELRLSNLIAGVQLPPGPRLSSNQGLTFLVFLDTLSLDKRDSDALVCRWSKNHSQGWFFVGKINNE
ncbi:hypothetical protein A2630_04545 [Candidatus Woesebacteria bacterium RIFCSPHIGHO2_01_FULL_44_10]|uniref:Uncharacterized protein n=1 Tax=Candidatus Woesebacteria bacterium RIFCSPLOWO2_01_FULL_44_14 TaxID=1802525 RepID=A0A1F8BYE2_9BACT|nr:MAG: hypothetical protein A2630_04545 [Candidatus Woesebacteria bacterium RIFCSPHIGHO2_01_FULL_44_10]OGM68599.1 MAG: hypothetical protein A2975_00730 [Candidatus Woesebacteria bacterium RIFCSPLOWO2_01_FULL_44_14]